MQRIGLVVFNGFQSMSFAGLSVFETANMMAGKPLYEMHYLSEKGGPIRSIMKLQARRELRAIFG